MMVNFMCQLGWAVSPRHVLQPYSDVSVTVFGDEINIETADLEQSSKFYVLWVGLVQSVEDLSRTEDSPPQARGNSAADGL